MMRQLSSRLIAAATVLCISSMQREPATAADWPMLGRDGTRNSVSPERNPPTNWDIGKPIGDNPGQRVAGTSKNIKWSARLGSQTHSTPVVSSGFVWIGTSKSQKGSSNDSVLKCFRESDGKEVYEYLSPQRGTRHQDPGWTGLGSSPLIEGDRLWITTNRSEVVCLDIGPLFRIEGPPRERWKLDLMREFDTSPYVPLMGPPRSCSIGPSWNGRIFVTTNNGIGDDHKSVAKPDAPSLVCLDKETGAVHWKDNSPGANILLTQFASPTVVEIRGEVQVIVPQGDGWLRSFDPQTGKILWEFDANHKTVEYAVTSSSKPSRNSLLGNAVVYGDRVYIATGRDVDQGSGQGRLVCIDPTRRGDISSELAVDAANTPLPRRRTLAVDLKAGEKAVPNPNSGLVWEFTNCGREFSDVLHRTMGSVAIAKDLLVIGDVEGLVQCFDAKTGRRHWSYDTLDMFWGSPLIVDDYVYLASSLGEVMIFGLSSDPDVALRKLNGQSRSFRTMSLDAPIYTSPVFANGTLYVAATHELFAIAADKKSPDIDLRRAGYWPQWRGPNRDNASSEKGLLKEWPEGGPPRLWTAVCLGDGIASVSVAEGKIFTLGYSDESECAVALEETTGELSWATRIGPAVAENPLMRWLCQRAPTVDGAHVYTLTAAGELVCLTAAGGKEVWRKSYTVDFSSKRPSWGFCDSPLVDGDKLICAPGGPKAKIVALDKLTGKVVWKTETTGTENDGAAYSALVVADVAGLRQYVTVLSHGVVGVAADDGRFLWRYNNLSSGTGNSHTSLVRGDEIFCSNGWGRGIALLKLVRNGKDITIQEVYKKNVGSDAFQDSSALVDDHIFLSTGSSTTGVYWKTGEIDLTRRLRIEGGGRVAIVYADGSLYYRNSSGKMVLVEFARHEVAQRGIFSIPDFEQAAGVTSPVIAGHRLYLRDNSRLHCYDIRADALERPATPTRTITLDVPAAAVRAGGVPVTAPGERRPPRGVYVPTPHDVVNKLLALAEVKKTDVVFDLGSGDGRIVVAAAKGYGCKAIGYEIDAELVSLSREKAKAAEVDKLVTIEKADVFTVDITPADVVTLYLLPQQLEKLVPQLKKLKPGSRIVSHQFEIPGLKLEKTMKMESQETGEMHAVHLYLIPAP